MSRLDELLDRLDREVVTREWWRSVEGRGDMVKRCADYIDGIRREIEDEVLASVYRAVKSGNRAG